MRKLLLAGCAVLWALSVPSLAVAGTFNSDGQFVGTISPAVTAIVAQYPDGGPALVEAIATLATAAPSLSDDLVQVALTSGNDDVKQAIGTGLARAAAVLSRSGNSGGASAILAALRFADSVTTAAFSFARSESVARQGSSGDKPPPQTSVGTGTTQLTVEGTCVSPARPDC
jgi:hypothetical protein